MPILVENTPEAGSLVGSMRSMGYSFESAVADIIDNSITAGSSEIRVFFPSEPSHCFVAVLDNGCGMSNKELHTAMRYGSTACEDIRAENDLGRFGLGMKAASLSQCRVMTVVPPSSSCSTTAAGPASGIATCLTPDSSSGISTIAPPPG